VGGLEDELTTLRAELLEARTDATLRLEAMRTLRAELDAARLERDEIREDDAACRAALASEHERAERAEKVLATVYAAVDEQGGYLHDANGNLAKAVSAVGKDLRFNIEKRTAAEAAWKDDEAKGMEREASLDAALSTSHAEVERLREALRSVLAFDQPWNLPDVLDRLANAADHLLTDHGCDTHGWEMARGCANRARKLSALGRSMQPLAYPLASSPPPPAPGAPPKERT
jgi:hypothetical protein